MAIGRGDYIYTARQAACSYCSLAGSAGSGCGKYTALQISEGQRCTGWKSLYSHGLRRDNDTDFIGGQLLRNICFFHKGEFLRLKPRTRCM